MCTDTGPGKKVHFNENNSNISGDKETLSDNKTINIYLNNKILDQISEIK